MTNNKVVIRSNTIQQWLTNKNPFDAVRGIKGLVVRCVDGRTTQRFEINGEGFYSKYHLGVGWTEIVKNLIRFRLPILGAKNEWLAINRLQELNVDTLTGSAFGSKGINPASKQSFIITEELVDVISLEDLTRDWLKTPPSFLLRTALINRVADMTRIMHEHGINHRDLYICHFLLDQSYLQGGGKDTAMKLHLIDLHRAQIRVVVPKRWLVKDVGSLYFSVLNIGFKRRDVYRFLRAYYQLPLREIFSQHGDFLSAVEGRAVNLYRRDFNCEPALPC
jgi:heptose I phosphotransferase